MKRVPEGEWTDYAPVRLYLDDVETLMDILRDACERWTFQAAGFEFHGSKELKEVGDKLKSLNLRGENPAISFELRPEHVRLYISDETDLKQLGVKEAVSATLRKRRLLRLGPPWLRLIPGPLVLAGGAAAVAPFGLHTGSESDLIFFGAYFLWYLALVLWAASLYSYFVRSDVRTIRSESVSSFLERNQDQLISGVVLVLFGLILGALAAGWFGSRS